MRVLALIFSLFSFSASAQMLENMGISDPHGNWLLHRLGDIGCILDTALGDGSLWMFTSAKGSIVLVIFPAPGTVLKDDEGQATIEFPEVSPNQFVFNYHTRDSETTIGIGYSEEIRDRFFGFQQMRIDIGDTTHIVDLNTTARIQNSFADCVNGDL